jgi:alginate O-acetyltransferase complex protein AlgI
MSFTSLVFYMSLAIAALLFYALPSRWRVAYLLAISCAFYATWSPKYLALLAATVVGVYWIGHKLHDAQTEAAKRRWLIGGLVLTLGPLVVFKVQAVHVGWLAPIGLSYYTFKLISYIVEIYWDDNAVHNNFVEFACFASFGPQMLSGPIQRGYEFFPQLREVRSGKTDFRQIESGLSLIIGGLMMKMIVGDQLAQFVTLIDASPGTYRRSVLLFTTLTYAAQLYADFAGYTNIAIGIGRIFGIDSPPNFNGPFCAANIQDFWRRWHMSLTRWLTDYVFMPVRMSTRRLGNAGLVLSIVMNLLLIGIWHGLTWTYAAFGLFHGVFMSVSALTLKGRNDFFAKTPSSVRKLRYFLGIVVTYLLVSFSQVFFQARTMSFAIQRFEQLAGTAPSGTLGFSDIRTDIAASLYLCLPIALYLGAGAPGSKFLTRPITRFVPNWVIYGCALLILSALTTSSGHGFVYGQF